jgi:hypothetical protein
MVANFCKSKSNKFIYKYPEMGDKIEPVDYKNNDNWLAIPKEAQKKVDIFFVYPTAWTSKPRQFPLADINNIDMRKQAYFDLKSRASAFESSGNIYAPYYRQYELNFLLDQGNLEESIEFLGGVPLTDILEAFKYYIEYHNKGKPFILVGHSQGAIMVMGILMKYMQEQPKIYERMIATYAIGIPITKQIYEKFSYLKPATNADDTGVIISYNTQSPIVNGENIFSIPNAVTINPISWKTTEEYASSNQSLGSNFIKEDGTSETIPHLADAKIDLARGVIITNVDRETYSSKPSIRKFLPLGVFHENDINLFYYDLQNNSENRIKKYFENNPYKISEKP